MQPCAPMRSPFTPSNMQILRSSPGHVQINHQHGRRVTRQHDGANARQPQRAHCDSSAGNASGGEQFRTMACTAERSAADSCDMANGCSSAGPVAKPADAAGANSAAGWPTGRRTCLASAAAAVAAMALPSPADAALTLERPQLFEQVGPLPPPCCQTSRLVHTVNNAACYRPCGSYASSCALIAPHTYPEVAQLLAHCCSGPIC